MRDNKSGGFRGGSRGGNDRNDGGFRGGQRGGGSGGNRGGGRGGNFRPSGPREMHKATCSDCARKQRFLSSHPKTDLYTAGNASRSTGQRDIRFIHI